ncbi:cytochrome P450 9e2 [Anabrus simplex]|uniref:cytochrome P450 9e2 n=1 Tax=Anabrus simplex TaxID=316456 RepID=UPI0035A27F91
MDLLSLTLTDWALGGTLLLFVLYKYGTWNHDYFKRKGIKNPKPLPFLGSMATMVFKAKPFAYLLEDICKEFEEEPFVGIFQFREPLVMVKDPELIKRITVKDFEFFTDHRQTITENADSLFSKNLFSLRGEKWRDMRATLSPAFTSSKMKNMFHFMNQCGQQLGDYLHKEISKQQPGKPFVLEMKDLFTRFTNDVIATSAFGVQVDSLTEKNNHFYTMGKAVTNFAGIKHLKFLGFMLFPKVMEFFGIGFLGKNEKQFFSDLVHQTISTREREGIVRPDMIHLLMQARKGELKGDHEKNGDMVNGSLKTKNIDLTDEDIEAQAMIFFFAGFDTASILLSFTSILLAIHKDIQRKLQQEVDEMLGEDQKLTYEKVQKMKYLDMVISESLRLYPPALLIDRLCVKNYTIPATEKQPEYTIKKGEGIWIPVYPIHHNPEYYPDPEKFNPERFSDENKNSINPYTYLPFGMGPRLCIGQRFVLLEAKVALVHILSRFNLTVMEKTPLPLRLTKDGFVMSVEGGFWVGATPRQQAAT